MKSKTSKNDPQFVVLGLGRYAVGSMPFGNFGLYSFQPLRVRGKVGKFVSPKTYDKSKPKTFLFFANKKAALDLSVALAELAEKIHDAPLYVKKGKRIRAIGGRK